MDHANTIIERLNRFENKVEDRLESIGKALQSLARTEERVSTLLTSNKDLQKYCHDLSRRLREIEISAASRKSDVDWIQRILWAVVAPMLTTGGVIGVAIYVIYKIGGAG